jgi:hypothetical protein
LLDRNVDCAEIAHRQGDHHGPRNSALDAWRSPPDYPPAGVLSIAAAAGDRSKSSPGQQPGFLSCLSAVSLGTAIAGANRRVPPFVLWASTTASDRISDSVRCRSSLILHRLLPKTGLHFSGRCSSATSRAFALGRRSLGHCLQRAPAPLRLAAKPCARTDQAAHLG